MIDVVAGLVLRRSLALLLCCGVAWSAWAQTATVRGFVSDASNGEALELVNVVLLAGEGQFAGGVTNADGSYVLPRVVPGIYVLRISFIGYEPYFENIQLTPGQQRTINIELRPNEALMGEVVVESERTGGAARITAGQQTVRPADIELVPAPDISGDLANLLSTLPGVVTLGDRGGQLFVRGGEPAQNLVQLDGVLLYQPFHLLGFFSAFPSDILSRTDIYAGGFSARFGERVSSVIDAQTRNGNNRRFEGAVSLSPFIGTARLEGPIIPGRVSFLASVRESLVQQGAARLVDEPLGFRFGDVFAKVHAQISRNSRLSIMGLRTHDSGALTGEVDADSRDEVAWKNQAASVRYVVLPRVSPVKLDLRASYSRLPATLGDPDNPARSSTISNLHIAGDVTFYGSPADVDWGFSLRIIDLESSLGGAFQDLFTETQQLEHVGVYIEPEFEWRNGFRLRPGLRAQFYDVRFGPFMEPRIRAVWARGAHQVSGAVGLYHQAVLGLNDRRDAANVFTVWTNVPQPTRRSEADPRAGKVPRATHGLLGYRVEAAQGLELSAEAFYKDLTNLFIAEWTAFPRFTTRLQSADGRSYGLDLRVEVRRPRFYGYVNYGYSNTQYTAQQAQLPLWYGSASLRFRPPHDRHHQLNALLSTTLRGVDLSVRWAFGSGLPFSQAAGFDGFALIDDVVDARDGDFSRRVIYEEPFNAVLPTYHRLDVSAERTFDLDVLTLTVQGSVLNIYNRRNLFYLDVFTLQRIDQLPLIPSFGLKLTFD